MFTREIFRKTLCCHQLLPFFFCIPTTTIISRQKQSFSILYNWMKLYSKFSITHIVWRHVSGIISFTLPHFIQNQMTSSHSGCAGICTQRFNRQPLRKPTNLHSFGVYMSPRRVSELAQGQSSRDVVINSNHKSHLCVNEADRDTWAHFQTAGFTFSAAWLSRQHAERETAKH